MALESLLLSRDPELVRQMRRAADDVGIAVEVCSSSETGNERLWRHKFDCVIVDCDGFSGAAELLKNLHNAPSNRRTIVFALINGKTTMREAFDLGAHFVLDKPLTVERTIRSLRAAQGFMINEQRRYFRQPIDTQAFLIFGVVKHLACRATNISGGGMAVRLPEQVSPNATVEVRFELPGVPDRLEAKGEFAWSDAQGRAGIKFVHLPGDSKRALQRWLAQKSNS